MTDMLTPYTQNDDVTVTFPDDDGQTSVKAWIECDGADDTPGWAQEVRHVQIDTNDGTYRGLVVHLNDGPPIYQGNPDVHPAAADVLRQVSAVVLNNPTAYAGRGPALDALNQLHGIIIRSGVVL